MLNRACASSRQPKNCWMERCLPQNLQRQDLLALLRRILQKCPQIVSGNRGENLIYFYLIAHFDHRVHRKQPWFLQWKLVSREAALACICHYPTQPIFIYVSHHESTMNSSLVTHLGLYHQKDTEMLCIFYIPELRRTRCLFEHSSGSHHDPNSHPRSVP